MIRICEIFKIGISITLIIFRLIKKYNFNIKVNLLIKYNYMFNLKLIIKATTAVLLAITVSLISSVSFAKTDVRIMWYGDGETEGVAFKNQIAKFHASNPNINVIVDEVP